MGNSSSATEKHRPRVDAENISKYEPQRSGIAPIPIRNEPLPKIPVSVESEKRDMIKNLTKGIAENYQNDSRRLTISDEAFNRFYVLFRLFVICPTTNQESHRQSIGDQIAEQNPLSLWVKYLKMFTNDKMAYPPHGKEFEAFNLIRSLILNCTDCSDMFCTNCYNNGFHLQLVKDLRKLKDTFSINTKNDRAYVMVSITILMNCAKADNGARFLRGMRGSVDIILWYANSDESRGCLCACCHVLIAYIAEENKISELITAGSEVISYLCKALKRAIREPSHRQNDFSVFEILLGLTKLAHNYRHSADISKHPRLFMFLKDLIYYGAAQEKEASINLLGAIGGFHISKKNIRKLDGRRMSLFEDDADFHLDHNESRSAAFQYHFMPTGETSGFSNSEGAVPLTATQAKALELENSGQLTQYSDTRIMISHHQLDGPGVLATIYSKLNAIGFKTWIKHSKMIGNIFDETATAIANANVILIAMSRKYEDNFSTRFEADCVTEKRKIFIPILVERGYQPTGWLGTMIKGKQVFDFSAGFSDNKFSELERTIIQLK